MNCLLMGLEVILFFFFMIIFYKINKKDGLYLYIALISSLLSIIVIGSIDVLSFKISVGIPLVVCLFLCNNVIIERYGLDEVKKILYTFGFSFGLPIIILSLGSLASNYCYGLCGNYIYDSLFGYSFSNFRCVISTFISIIFMIWIGSGIYYSFKKNRNMFVISNIVTSFVIFFVESLIFVFISSAGSFTLVELFGMISVTYIIEIIISVLGIVPVCVLVKYIDK